MTPIPGTSRPLRIAVCCFPTFGGSGVVATELARGLARRGHELHVVAYDLPPRLAGTGDAIHVHRVEAFEYPLFPENPYALAMASRLVEVCRKHSLDIIHAHYAVPHAASAYLAAQILGDHRPRVVTTLHGTDATVVGAHPAYLPVTRFSIEQSDAVTVPSAFLERATFDCLGVRADMPIHVLPNFVDTSRYAPATRDRRVAVRRLFAGGAHPVVESTRVLIHASNFRPIKRVSDVVATFALAAESMDVRLVLVGDGPERSTLEAEVWARGLGERVRFLGEQTCFIEVLQGSDAFLLPSESESFGLAALEAMACSVPVVASNVGGIPEVVAHGESGRLCAVGDTAAMAAAVVEITERADVHERYRAAARTRAVAHFSMEPAVARYEELYARLLDGGLSQSGRAPSRPPRAE